MEANATQQIQKLEGELQLYKKRLLTLARSHAALLSLTSPSSSGVLMGSQDTSDLISHSQLDDDDDVENLNSQETRNTPTTLSQQSQSLDAPNTKHQSWQDAQRSFANFLLEWTSSAQGPQPPSKENCKDEEWLQWIRSQPDFLPDQTQGIQNSEGETSISASADLPIKPPQKHVRVGVAVLVKDPRNPQKVFAGKRKGSHGAGTLALPGGHLELNETWYDCAAREVHEEMDLQVRNMTFVHVTNDIMKSESKHYVTIFLAAECVDPNKEPRNMEPHKCEGWDSYSWNELHTIYLTNKNSEENDDGDEEENQRKRPKNHKVQLFGPLDQLIHDQPKPVQSFLLSQGNQE